MSRETQVTRATRRMKCRESVAERRGERNSGRRPRGRGVNPVRVLVCCCGRPLRARGGRADWLSSEEERGRGGGMEQGGHLTSDAFKSLCRSRWPSVVKGVPPCCEVGLASPAA